MFEEPTASGLVTVSPKGEIQNNLLGHIRVENLTPEEIRDLLTERFSEFIRNPRVSVTVMEFNARKVYVFGGVTKPGPYPLRENTTLLQILIADAGGPTGTAYGTINILRGYLGKGETPPTSLSDAEANPAAPAGYEKIQVELDELVKPEGGIPQDIVLKDGDIIFVPTSTASPADQNKRVLVSGAVEHPGIYVIEGPNYTALNAVLAAGGFTKFAAKNRVRLIRTEEGRTEERIIRLGDVMQGQKEADVLLVPGDTLVVPEGLF